ncbi:wax ester/triacylglycerol synthase domain-containing protein [Georgenia sp. SUBG003]|uniref:wax ester/triacylglycerol synthase domain-containing protein n=1 Tax=Georgenia sp. SUBG003 TaxID=1497974 RepID=UPI000694ABB4
MPVRRLSAEDELMLRLDALWPQDIGVIGILDGEALLDPDGSLRIEALREEIGARLERAPRFRQVVRSPGRLRGGPIWVDAPAVDLGHHVGVRPLPEGSGDTQLLDAVQTLRRRRLDPSRPLWEMWFLPGLDGGRVGYFVRWQHAVADGRAATTLLAAFLEPEPDAVRAEPAQWAPAPWPSDHELVLDHLRHRARRLAAMLHVLARPCTTVRRVRDAVPMLRETLTQKPGPETSLNRLVGLDRRFALIRTRLRDVGQIADHHGATVNDVLLALTAAGLRALLSSRGELVPGVSVPVYVPVSLRSAARGPVEGNLISQMVVNVPLDVDPAGRLRRIAAGAARRKRVSRPSLGALFRSRTVSRLMLRAINGQRVNVETGNVRGPSSSQYLVGAQLLEVFPVLNLVGRVGLGVGAVSYAGAFDVAITADRDTYPDLDVFIAGARNELDALAASLHQRREPPDVDGSAASESG